MAYDVTGMLDKNKDSLFQDLVDLLCLSNIPLLQVLYNLYYFINNIRNIYFLIYYTIIGFMLTVNFLGIVPSNEEN